MHCPRCDHEFVVHPTPVIQVGSTQRELAALEHKLDALHTLMTRSFTTMANTLDDIFGAIQAGNAAISADLQTLSGELALLLQKLQTEVVSQAHIDQGNALVAGLQAAAASLHGLVVQAAQPDQSAPPASPSHA